MFRSKNPYKKVGVPLVPVDNVYIFIYIHIHTKTPLSHFKKKLRQKRERKDRK